MASYMDDFFSAKEYRWDEITRLFEEYKSPLITLNLNIKGMHKDKDEYESIYLAAKKFLNTYELVYEDFDSYSAIYLAKSDAISEKKNFVAIEERHDYMRFVDIDVIDTDLKPVSRAELGLTKRTCIVCGSDRFFCMRESRHSQEEFNAVLNRTLINLDK